MKKVVHPEYADHKSTIEHAIANFNEIGQRVGRGKRNTLKRIVMDDWSINVKAFKLPDPFKSFIYRYLRQSKARRSYEYALRLISKGIGTPHPIAYIEERQMSGLGRSFYVCEHIDDAITIRTITENPAYPEREKILRQFAAFTLKLHSEQILFLDHARGNTLIKKKANGDYSFYLVDLNRMKFNASMGFERRMKNFARLTVSDEMLAVISDEYAKLAGMEPENAFERMTYHSHKNFRRIARQKRHHKRFGQYKQA